MILRTMRFSGALALLAVGAIHLQQYAGSGYEQVPTIGTLFLLNMISCTVVGVGLLLPVGRWLGARRADAVVGMLAAGGALIALLSLIALFISETSTLFGFSEDGYKTAIMASIGAEAVALLLLGTVAVASVLRLRAATRQPRTARPQAQPLRAV
ncbi:MAG TPA: hypothetical protein VGF70_08980 [Solirubrobacteraceae bacterium]|jgi:hypothetical protein